MSQSKRVLLRIAVVCACVLVVGCAVAVTQLPSLGAAVMLRPVRTTVYHARPAGCSEREFTGEGITLGGWQCAAAGHRRASLVYLHGISDNRASGVGIISRFTKRGFDVVAYDSRGHGTSGGDMCTFGYLEKRDLQRVIAALDPGPVVLVGTSLGAAVALQGAVQQPRVIAVVAAEVFSDLRTVARDRVPVFLPDWLLRRSFRLAEHRGHFEVSAVSPVMAARSLRIPVLLIHGAKDRDTPPAHSRRVFSALRGPKRLIVVDAGHSRSLSNPAVWTQVDRWLEEVVPFTWGKQMIDDRGQG